MSLNGSLVGREKKMRGSQFNNPILAGGGSLEAAQRTSCREGVLQMAQLACFLGAFILQAGVLVVRALLK